MSIHLPPTETSLLVRTDFSSDQAWADLLRRVREPLDVAPGVEFAADVETVDDLRNEGATIADFVEAAAGNESLFYVFVADAETFATDESLILAIDLDAEPGQGVRVPPAQMWAIENNLSLANMDFSDFTTSAVAGVFRGFPDTGTTDAVDQHGPPDDLQPRTYEQARLHEPTPRLHEPRQWRDDAPDPPAKQPVVIHTGYDQPPDLTLANRRPDDPGADTNAIARAVVTAAAEKYGPTRVTGAQTFVPWIPDAPGFVAGCQAIVDNTPIFYAAVVTDTPGQFLVYELPPGGATFKR